MTPAFQSLVSRLIVRLVRKNYTLSLQIAISKKRIYDLGSVIFLRSYAVKHYIVSFVGNRYSVIHFTHQSVHDACREDWETFAGV